MRRSLFLLIQSPYFGTSALSRMQLCLKFGECPRRRKKDVTKCQESINHRGRGTELLWSNESMCASVPERRWNSIAYWIERILEMLSCPQIQQLNPLLQQWRCSSIAKNLYIMPDAFQDMTIDRYQTIGLFLSQRVRKWRPLCAGTGPG